MGLRLEEGIDIARLERLALRPLNQTLNAEKLRDFRHEGWLTIDNQRLSATEAGFARLNAIINALLQLDNAKVAADVG